MSIPNEGYPRAAAVVPRLQFIETVDSTNARLLHDVRDAPDSHPHLSVLFTRDQRAGRGRLDRVWSAPPGSALAISVLLRVGAVAVADRGWIPLIAGAAMADAVATQLPRARVDVKWPNDVLVEQESQAGAGREVGARKICGILAEVAPSDPFAVVVGAGVNTAMSTADLPVPTATSFADQGVVADEDQLLADYLTALRDGIADLAVGGHAAVAARISARCRTIGSVVAVSMPDGSTVRGRGERLDDAGCLVISGEAGEVVVGAGDVVHVR